MSHLRLVALVLLGLGCEAELTSFDDWTMGAAAADCATPSQGCPCQNPGEAADCGEVMETSGERVLCSRGERLCQDNGTWGSCEPEAARLVSRATRNKKLLGLGTAADCGALNPCDPYCTYVDDDAEDLEDELPPGLCEGTTGLELCPRCDDYTSPHRSFGYDGMPSSLKTNPDTCVSPPTASGQGCNYDMECRSGTCVVPNSPCYDDNPPSCSIATKVDFTMGPPCVSSGSYHIPVCNRGSARAQAGTLRIGIYGSTAASRTDDCVSSFYTAATHGYIDIALSGTPGRYIEPGQCIDVTPANSTLYNSSGGATTVAAVFGAGYNRIMAVNYRAGIQECNYCNNWNVYVTGSSCTGCTNLECDQVCSTTTLNGTIYDPAGLNPLPNVAVYVPNGTPAASLDNDVGCDQCSDALYSGDPLVSTMTAANGTFTLTNMPSGTNVPLVIQTGRWRRQVTVSPITACASATLPAGESQRLPSKASEGDIPRMAIIMGDGDPIQCLFRRIGLEASVFGKTSDGFATKRIHLYNHNGMLYSGARPGMNTSGWLAAHKPPAIAGTPLLDDTAQMDKYQAIFSTCDYAHDYPAYVERAGVTYNGLPFHSTTAANRANMLSYVNKGGRLFTSHWLSMDFVHLNYNPPPEPSTSYEFLSPYNLNDFSAAFRTAFNAELSQYSPARTWTYTAPSAFNPSAPAVHVFGRPVEATANNAEPKPPSFAPTTPSFNYTIDTSTTMGSTFSAWANLVGASPGGAGTVKFNTWSPMVRHVRAPAVTLAYGDSSNGGSQDPVDTFAPAAEPCLFPDAVNTSIADTYHCQGGTDNMYTGPHVSLFYFDTPWGSPAESQCGRLVVSQNHVSTHECFMPSYSNRNVPSCAAPPDKFKQCQTNSDTSVAYTVDSGANPAPDCGAIDLSVAADWGRGCGSLTTMTPQEKAFEFLVFATTECVGTATTTPPTVPLIPQTFVRDYEANCDVGEQPRWQYLYWQSTIPAGTSITFTAQTADTQAALTSATAVEIGESTTTTSTWTTDSDTIDSHLVDDATTLSREWLRVSITLEPNGTATPILNSWRLTYDCMPAE